MESAGEESSSSLSSSERISVLTKIALEGAGEESSSKRIWDIKV